MVAETLTTLASSAGFPLIGGGAIGFGVGYFLKKVLKFILLGLGATMLLQGYLEYQKWISANWTIIEQNVTNTLNNTAHKIYAVTQQMGHEIPSGIGFGLIGFAPGMALGFLKG